MTLIRDFQEPTIIELLPTGEWVAHRTHDGIYAGDSSSKPDQAWVDDQLYNLFLISGVPVSPESQVCAKNLRLKTLGARRDFNDTVRSLLLDAVRGDAGQRFVARKTSQDAGQTNINDGIYVDPNNGLPAFAVIDGCTYKMTPKSAGSMKSLITFVRAKLAPGQ